MTDSITPDSVKGTPVEKSPIDYPKLEMPEEPFLPGMPPFTGVRPDCEGQTELFQDPTTSQVKPPPEGKARILIGVPILMVTYEFFESFLRFWTSLIAQNDPRYEVCYQFAYRRPVHMAEEFLVNVAHYNKCTHILFIDDDIYDINPDMLNKLFAADKDVISGVMFASKFPHATCAFRRFDPSRKVIDMPVDKSIYRLYEIPCLCPKCGVGQAFWDAKFCVSCGSPMDNLIQRVDLIPFCFTLMKLSVFSKIKRPWFHCTLGYPSDSWFADRILEAGLSEHVHMGVRLNHAGVNDETKPHFVQMGMAKARSQKAVVELSQQDMDKHQEMLHNRMVETESRIKEKPEIIYQGHVVANTGNGKPLTLVSHGR